MDTLFGKKCLCANWIALLTSGIMLRSSQKAVASGVHSVRDRGGSVIGIGLQIHRRVDTKGPSRFRNEEPLLYSRLLVRTKISKSSQSAQPPDLQVAVLCRRIVTMKPKRVKSLLTCDL